jgi:CRP-like cAMP-binding protein
MAIKQLILYFDSYLSLDDKEKEELSKRVTERKIKRKQYILQEGDICKHYFFIVEGCFKMYGVDNKGEEHNIQFAAENDWITDIGSLHTEKPSQLFIEAIEPSIILQIEKRELIYLYVNHPKFDRIFRVIIENKFVELQNRVLQNISSTAEDRYLAFLEQYPKLSLRLPNTQIASYLGITPEFLSKIRKDLASK